ncbi:hypothetical protein HYH02_000208 [Chlamydomonas schloesseri]|uniref:Alpha 1,4-glycosyltransferase domain-containing protein n=1 Tax=Chlamydomonas schloesseri TaxID=2026947 RepID=A0A835WLS1_9CHLO|nr:hypothetical protein HYH02_000208 [Chlamydomonas schloesseri]|eukprot:KAG2450104.1 hypothetical protein HYH02_000208 [Chlamydomonas schloesseri]
MSDTLTWPRCGLALIVLATASCVPRTAALDKADVRDVCSFYAVGRANIHDPWNWGPFHICDTSALPRWLEAAAANCFDCSKRRPVCGPTAPQLHFHVYFQKWSQHWKYDLQTYQAFLLTQNLHRARLTVWVDNATAVLAHPAGQFLQKYAEFISVQEVVWERAVVGTPLQSHSFWRDGALVRKNIYTAAGFADVLRLLLLYQHGGVWLDTDVVLLQDMYPPTVQIGYQFAMRWTNNHVMYLRRGSPLGRRMLQAVASLPYTDEATARGYVERLCKPLGYVTAHAKYGYTDIYNICILKLFQEHDNTTLANGGDPDDILFTRPLGWYDNDWPGCLAGRQVANDSEIQHVLSTHMALHSRLIQDNGYQPHSLYAAVTQLLDDFFALCTDTACIPRQAVRLAVYRDVVAQMKRNAQLLPAVASGSSGRQSAEGNGGAGGGQAGGEANRQLITGRSQQSGAQEAVRRENGYPSFLDRFGPTPPRLSFVRSTPRSSAGPAMCNICGNTNGGKNLHRDHATTVGLVLHDLAGITGALVSRFHHLDTMIGKINAMVAHTPPEQRALWYSAPGRAPLCKSFMCPCCKRLLPSASANAHMVAALSHISHRLDSQSRARFEAVRLRGDLAARRAMREMLDRHAAAEPAGASTIDDAIEGFHWCGHPPLTQQEGEAQQRLGDFLKERWSNSHVYRPSTPPPALPSPPHSQNLQLQLELKQLLQEHHERQRQRQLGYANVRGPAAQAADAATAPAAASSVISAEYEANGGRLGSRERTQVLLSALAASLLMQLQLALWMQSQQCLPAAERVDVAGADVPRMTVPRAQQMHGYLQQLAMQQQQQQPPSLQQLLQNQHEPMQQPSYAGVLAAAGQAEPAAADASAAVSLATDDDEGNRPAKPAGGLANTRVALQQALPRLQAQHVQPQSLTAAACAPEGDELMQTTARDGGRRNVRMRDEGPDNQGDCKRVRTEWPAPGRVPPWLAVL